MPADLFNMMRNLGGAVGIARMRRDHQRPHQFPFRRDRIQSDAGKRRNDAIGRRDGASVTASIPGSLQAGHTAALKQLWQLAYREASTLAYADAFRAIMIAFVVATLLVPLLRNIAEPKPAGVPSH